MDTKRGIRVTSVKWTIQAELGDHLAMDVMELSKTVELSTNVLALLEYNSLVLKGPFSIAEV